MIQKEYTKEKDKDRSYSIAEIRYGVNFIFPYTYNYLIDVCYLNIWLTIPRAFETAVEENKQLSGPKLIKQAIYEAENYGIVFIDEFDKIAKPSSTWQNSQVSSEGVQRDLLPIIEGTKVWISMEKKLS
jgi:hypothetical protein